MSAPFGVGGTADPATQPQFVCAASTRNLTRWFNPCAFRNAPQAYDGPDDPAHNLVDITHAGTLPFGPRGRESVTGPGFNRLDMSLFKSFPIPVFESSLELRADAFNLLNHPSFSDPSNSLTGSTAGSITSTRFSTLEPNARVLQVAMRYSF